jgi:hypothetical protein
MVFPIEVRTMSRFFRGSLFGDLAEAGGAGSAFGFCAGYLYARIYNWAYEPQEPEDPVWQGENGVGLVLSVVIPVVLVGHLLVSLGLS